MTDNLPVAYPHLTPCHHCHRIPPNMKDLRFGTTITTTSGIRREVFVHRP
ncbi:MAG: hypothetical protein HRF47_04815 [Chloroflexota bacterium]